MTVPIRVLVVDDDVVDRKAVGRALRQSGLDVALEEAETAVEARRLLLARSLDCVFLDYMLPDGDGLMLVEEVRRAGIRVPLVILTGQGDEETAVRLMKAGATDYLPKGHATPERIEQVVRSCLRVYEAERRAALAEAERMRLLVAEHEARAEAEAARSRLAYLAEAGALLGSSLDQRTTLETVARLAVPSLADWCFVDLAEPGGGFDRLAVAHVDPALGEIANRLRRRYRGSEGRPHGVPRVLATGRPDLIPQVRPDVVSVVALDDDHRDVLERLAVRSAMSVPLLARGRILGAMTFLATTSGRVYGEHDIAFAEEIARRAALAVDNARLYEEAVEAEARLRHQLGFTSAITTSLAEGLLAVDAQGRVTFLNPAAEALLGRDRGDVVGATAHAVLHGPHGDAESEDGERTVPVESARCGLLAALADGAVRREHDDAFARPDGTVFRASWTLSPIVAGGEVAGAVLAFHDITERKRAEAELEANRRQMAMSEKLSALGTLVSGVAHEIRTPLTYIANNLFLVRARLGAIERRHPAVADDVARAVAFSEAAMEGVDRITALLRDLRPFANPGGGERADADLRDVVRGAVELFRATHRGRVTLDEHLGPAPPVKVDRGQIQQAVLNLLINAAEAMPRGGNVRVTTRTATAESEGEIEVEDDGPGMVPEVQARIFDPFFTTKPDGTGLGLAITRRIVEAHGGSIAFATAPGRGTRFTIALPATATQPAARSEPATTG